MEDYGVENIIEKAIERPESEGVEVLEIYFSDLNETAQNDVLDFYDITIPEELNLDTEPIFILERSDL